MNRPADPEDSCPLSAPGSEEDGPVRVVLLHDASPALAEAEALCARLEANAGVGAFELARQDIATVAYPYVLEEFFERIDRADMLLCALADRPEYEETLTTCLKGVAASDRPERMALALILSTASPRPVQQTRLWRLFESLAEARDLDCFARVCESPGQPDSPLRLD